jgi:hypothetical protein
VISSPLEKWLHTICNPMDRTEKYLVICMVGRVWGLAEMDNCIGGRERKTLIGEKVG